MTDTGKTGTNWRLKGLLFENCNCQLVCPAHISFKQLCTYERCMGHWSIHIDEGELDGIFLQGLNIVILYDTPQLMFNGGWIETLFIDERADDAQRRAIEDILTGRVGGPWVILGRFVEKRRPTRYLPIRFEDQGRKKRMWIEGVFDTTINSLRGQDRDRDVVIENMFNQLHATSQVVASGETWWKDGEYTFSTKGTHALYSRFSWSSQGQ